MTVIAPEHRVVLIRIPKTAPADDDQEALYAATREWWSVGEPRTICAPTAPTHALAVVKGRVVQAYVIDSWEQRDDGKRRFAGRPALDAVARYVGGDVSAYFPPGSQNPLRYLHCAGAVSADLTIDRSMQRTERHVTAPGWGSTKATAPWRGAPDADHRRDSALRVAALASSDGLHPEVRRRQLKELFWFMTEWTGKHTTRYRSLAALQLQASLPVGTWVKQVSHEHVFTKKSLSEQLLASPRSEDAHWEVLRRAVACVVTKEEHTALTAFDKTHEGWARYVAAGVAVVDMATGQVLTPDDIAATLVADEA